MSSVNNSTRNEYHKNYIYMICGLIDHWEVNEIPPAAEEFDIRYYQNFMTKEEANIQLVQYGDEFCTLECCNRYALPKEKMFQMYISHYANEEDVKIANKYYIDYVTYDGEERTNIINDALVMQEFLLEDFIYFYGTDLYNEICDKKNFLPAGFDKGLLKNIVI